MGKFGQQKYKELSRDHFEELSSHYSDACAGKYTEPMHYDIIQELAGRNFERLLDVGCGTGTFLSMVSNKFHARVSGIDISPGMIERSRELLGHRVDLRVGDSEHLPWEDKSFDIITCIASFHHYPSPELVLREMRRVLRSGGHLIIADPWAPNPFRFLVNLVLRSRFNSAGDVRVYTQDEMEKLLKDCGFTSAKWMIKGNLLRRYFIVTASPGQRS